MKKLLIAVVISAVIVFSTPLAVRAASVTDTEGTITFNTTARTWSYLGPFGSFGGTMDFLEGGGGCVQFAGGSNGGGSIDANICGGFGFIQLYPQSGGSVIISGPVT